MLWSMWPCVSFKGFFWPWLLILRYDQGQFFHPKKFRSAINISNERLIHPVKAKSRRNSDGSGKVKGWPRSIKKGWLWNDLIMKLNDSSGISCYIELNAEFNAWMGSSIENTGLTLYIFIRPWLDRQIRVECESTQPLSGYWFPLVICNHILPAYCFLLSKWSPLVRMKWK